MQYDENKIASAISSKNSSPFKSGEADAQVLSEK